MKNLLQIIFCFLLLMSPRYSNAQGNGNPAPYCNGSYGSGNCNQGGPSNTPGNFINDFINTFVTSGGNDNINNTNSGCNNGPNNYNFYCNSYLSVNPGATITCTLQSGIIFSQGFALWVDWNQDGVFQNPGEQVAATGNVPAAGTFTTLSFTVPMGLPNGTYRLRVRCAYATPGVNITPCGPFGFGETEDYNLIVGPPSANSGILSATLTSNSPICAGQTLSLTSLTNYNAGVTYSWTGPGAYASSLPNPVISNASPTATGIYTFVASNGLCPTSKTINVRVVAYPNYTPAPVSFTICQGGSFTPSVNFASGQSPAAFNYSWTSPTGTLGNTIWNPHQQSTIIQPLLLPTSVTLATLFYSVTVSDTGLYCPITKTLPLTINNPLTPTLNMPPPKCHTHNPVQLTATPGGGTWTGNPAVSLGGIMTPSLANTNTISNSVVYSVSVGTCVVSNSATFSVSRYHTPALTFTPGLACVQDPSMNLMAIVQDTVSGYWQYPSATNPASVVTSNVFNPALYATGVYTLTYHTLSTINNLTVTSHANVCPDSIRLPLSVFDPPIPVINPISPVCNTYPQATLTASPPGGAWSLNSGVSASGVQTPSLGSIGTNTVVYSAGQGTCQASATANFHVSQYNSPAFTATVPHLCVNSTPVNLMSIVQTTNGSWSGAGVVSGPSGGYKFNPSQLPTNTYVLTYNTTSFPTPGLCDASNTIAVSVLNPPSPSISQLGPYCNTNGAVQLSVTPATGTWTPYSYVNTSGVFVPSLALIGNNAVQYIIGTSTCNTHQTKFISVEAFVKADITTPVPDQCNTGSPVNLIPLTVSGLGTWIGPGVQGTNFNPSVSGAGVFTLTYHTASSPSGLCPDQHTLSVNVYSLAPPVFDPLDPICERSSAIQLQVSPVGGLFSGNNTGAVSPGGVFNPAVGHIGDNIISYSISVGPCIAYAQTSILIEKFVSADFEIYPEASYCKNHLPFNLNSLVFNPGGTWSGDGVTGNMFDPAKANTGASNFVTYQTKSFPSGLCPDSKQITITIDEIPHVSLAANVQQGCAPLTVNLNIPQSNGGKSEWNVGDGSGSLEGTAVSHVFTTPGTYSVVANYSLGACHTSATLLNPITVHQSPTADFYFSKSELSISEPEVMALNQSQVPGNNKYEWNIQGQEPRYDVSPLIKFTKIGTYQVTLKATTISGCSHEISKLIEVKNDFNVYIPNSFTPNEDGLNDVFMPVFSPYGLDEKTYQMEIFDRWGHSICKTRDLTIGWDGSFGNKGLEPMKEDTYVYIITYRDMEGKSFQQVGSLSLLPN